MYRERLEKDLRGSCLVVVQNLEHKMHCNLLEKDLVWSDFVVGQGLE